MSVSPLRLFVYGTLKRGQRSHADYCRGASAIEPATVLGRLYHLAAGYPMLVVPEPTIAAVGTADPIADLTTQLGWEDRSANATGLGSRLGPLDRSPAEQDWEPIEGEVLSFADPNAVLSQLDLFEDFRPGSAETTYIRALVTLASDRPRCVWTYVAPGGNVPAGARRIHRRWP